MEPGRLTGRRVQEKVKEEGEADEDSGGRRTRSEIAQEVVAGIKEKARAHDDAKATAKLELFANRKRRRRGRG